MSRNKLSEQIKSIIINDIEEEFIIGCILGDGTLSKSGKHYRLRVEQKADHYEYVKWKFDRLNRLCLTPPQYNKKNNSFRFGTVGHPRLSEIKINFYFNDNSINPEIISKINRLAIAVWFMDDGYKINNTVGISSNNFSLIALKQLQSRLLQFGLSTNLQSDKGRKRIYFSTKCYYSFNKIVKPFIGQVKCMAYKLPNPVETTRKLPQKWDEDIVQSLQ